MRGWGLLELAHRLAWGAALRWLNQCISYLYCAQDVWRLPPLPSQGLVEQWALEPLAPGASGAAGWGGSGCWLLTGTNRGWVTAWDVRFMLPAHAFQHPMR